jgi:hypothetical protein
MDYGTLGHQKGVADSNREELWQQAEALRISDQPRRQFNFQFPSVAGSLGRRTAQFTRNYWWVPAGFAMLFLVRTILGG